MTASAGQSLDDLARRAGVEVVQLHLLVADRCNHTCAHCYQVHGLRGEMEFRDVVKVIENFRASGGLVLSISGGEATLRPDLIQILEYARDGGLATILYTNGFTIDAELADALAACRLWRVDVSVYSHVADDHDALTRVAGSWARSTNAIRLLTSRGVRVRMKTTLTSAAHRTSFEELERLARELGCDLQVADQVSAGETGELDPLLHRLEPARAAAFAAVGCDASGDDAPSHLGRRPCAVAAGALAVRSDGMIVPCTNLHVAVGRGDASAPIGETIRLSEVAAFLRSLTWGWLHGCRDCDLTAICGRCHASALAESGDMLGPYLGGCASATARHAVRVGRLEMLPPEPECGPDRDTRLGPYRIERNGALRPVPHVRTESDEGIAKKFPWIRSNKDQLLDLARRRLPGGHKPQQDQAHKGLDERKAPR